jgi:hypothetical protein
MHVHVISVGEGKKMHWVLKYKKELMITSLYGDINWSLMYHNDPSNVAVYQTDNVQLNCYSLKQMEIIGLYEDIC